MGLADKKAVKSMIPRVGKWNRGDVEGRHLNFRLLLDLLFIGQLVEVFGECRGLLEEPNNRRRNTASNRKSCSKRRQCRKPDKPNFYNSATPSEMFEGAKKYP